MKINSCAPGGLPFARRLLFLTVVGGSMAPLPGQNLLYNGDFNTPDQASPAGWSPVMIPGTKTPLPQFVQQYVPGGGWDGTACIEVGRSHTNLMEMMYGETEKFARYKLNSDRTIAVNSNGYYRLSVQYRTDGMDPAHGNHALVDLDFWNGIPKSGGTFIDSHNHFLEPSNSAWGTYTVYFRPIRSTDRGYGGVSATHLSVKCGVVSSAGTARFDNISVVEVSAHEYWSNLPYRAMQPDPLTSRRGKFPSFSPSNAFTVRRDGGGAWWFVRPDGTPFWWRSVPFVKVRNSINPEHFANLPVTERSGDLSNAAYSHKSFLRLGSLGFNAEAAASDNSRHPRMHYMAVDTPDYPSGIFMKDRNGNTIKGRKPMPDPYNPTWQSFITNHIRTELYNYSQMEAPEFAGYFTDNEMAVEVLSDFIWSDYCAPRFVQFMQARYGSIATVNSRWTNASIGRTFSMGSFSDIPANKAKIRRWLASDPLGDDLDAFVKQMLKDYYHFICATIRQVEVEKFGDSNRDGIADRKFLICTNRFDLNGFPNNHVPELMLAMQAIAELNASRPGFYFDVLAVNNYPGDEHKEGVKGRDNFWMLERMSQRSGLPVLVSEFAVHARNSGIPTGNNTTRDIGWLNRSVDTDADRAMVYDKMVRQWASSPHIVGAQWFKWSNVLQTNDATARLPVPTESSTYIGRNSGIVDHRDQFYGQLASQMQATHETLDQAFRHTGSYLRPGQVTFVKTWNGAGFEEMMYNYATGVVTGSGWLGNSAWIVQPLPAGQWTGMYHYDYAAGRFTQSLYRTKNRN